MNEQPTTPSDDASATPAPQPSVNRGRRRLGTLGISGTAVALSVTSRSAVAGWGTCTGSELASGNLSKAGSANPCGCSPGFWFKSPGGIELWTNSPTLNINYSRDSSFNTVFGRDYFGSWTNGSFVANPNVKLKDVGNTQGNAVAIANKYNCNKAVAFHAVAALLNAQYYGARYPVTGMQTAAGVISAFQTDFAGGKTALQDGFKAKVDIYATWPDLWCSGSPENNTW
ncbi:MAG: hypothetical protein IPF94_12455 [Betaproteobacteria bacterium]|nr:hypothetical protein [Betaproteobacteria bacterium]